MEVERLEPELGIWRTEGTGKSVAMTGSADLRIDGKEVLHRQPLHLRWSWRVRSVAGQMVELARVVAVARADTRADDPAPTAAAALSRTRAIGWRAALGAHEAAWRSVGTSERSLLRATTTWSRRFASPFIT